MTKPTALYYSILKYQPENRKRLDRLFKVVEIETPDHDTLDVLAKITVLFAPLGYFVGKERIDAAPNLKVIASNTTGHPHIDVDYAESRGIRVACLKYAQDFLKTITPTAELTWGHIITLTRNVLPAHKSVLSGNWDRRPFGAPAMLSSLKLGIVGLGRLGRMVAQYGLTFGMEVGYYDPYVDEVELEVKRTGSLSELVSQYDIISIHVPHEPETEGMFDKKIFNSFKRGSYLINTARGELLDWDELLRALQNGKLSGAALDVFEGEFVPGFQDSFRDHSLLQYAREHENLLLTPHIGGSTVDAWFKTESHTIDMIVSFLEKENE